MIFLNLISIFFILLFFLYFDLKFRRIPNRFIKYFFIYACFLKNIELFLYRDVFLNDFFLKILVLILILIIHFFMYHLKIIKGGDLKVVLLMYLIMPLNILLFFVFYFSIFMFLLIIVIIFFYLLINVENNKKEIYELFFNTFFDAYGISKTSKKFWIKMCYRFTNLEDINKKTQQTFRIFELDFFYNPIKKKLQILSYCIYPWVFFYFFAYVLFLILYFNTFKINFILV